MWGGQGNQDPLLVKGLSTGPMVDGVRNVLNSVVESVACGILEH